MEKNSMYVFIDESGDLGRNGSKYFIIVALATFFPSEIIRIPKNIRRRKLKRKMKDLAEIKANNSNETIRRYVLGKLNSCQCMIYSIIVPKQKIKEELFRQKEKLYAYFCSLLLDQIEINGKTADITIDKKYNNNFLLQNFNKTLISKTKLKSKWSEVKINHVELRVCHGLQVVDFVAWAINRKYSFCDSSYYGLIKDRISKQLVL